MNQIIYSRDSRERDVKTCFVPIPIVMNLVSLLFLNDGWAGQSIADDQSIGNFSLLLFQSNHT